MLGSKLVSLKLWAEYSQFGKSVRKFLRNERGDVIQTVLIIGVIALPLILFLSLFGKNVIEWVQKHAPNIFEEATSWIG